MNHPVATKLLVSVIARVVSGYNTKTSTRILYLQRLVGHISVEDMLFDLVNVTEPDQDLRLLTFLGRAIWSSDWFYALVLLRTT